MSDTIAAIATAPGQGGIAIVRVSGNMAEDILRRIFRPVGGKHPLPTHLLTYGYIVEDTERIDECMAVIMRAPKSYTREDVVEFQLHGGGCVAQKVLAMCLSSGARLAQPGEFTRRAFLNGRIDLSQAEAVMDLIAAQGEHMVDAVVKVGLQLFPDIFLGVADAGEVRHRGALAVLLDLVQNFQVLADVGAAGAVGTGNIVGLKGVELVQNSVLAAQLFHAHVRLGREDLKGESRSFFVDVCYAHNCLHIQNRLPEWLHAGIKPAWIRYKIIVSHLTGNYKTCGAQIYEKKHFFLHS